ncbi:MAG: helix-turn-helix domain-containing protein [Solirubrobacterales bacterium]|nr:helix-turn-helix domain-containing protein [Solirubrobacterales bacterium]MBV9798384.1 helix-turn-helix domain-containing protein [Solirubrobacterales bacterium]
MRSRTELCNTFYPGTREGVILVEDITPKRSDRSRRAADNGERRRAELADFLRTRRDALKPEDVGLPNGGRRRTPGLRREEVAQLAGVGATWYTWLEQGRDVRASLEVLEALARALRLTTAERTHLILLGRGEEVPPCKPPRERVPPSIRRLVESLGPGPAYVLGRRWDYLAWNRPMEAVFSWKPTRDPLSRNHVWQMFMEPSRRELMPDWANGTRLLVAKFRADSARNLGDPAFEELIGALLSASPEFGKLWNKHEVAGISDGRKELEHPVVGRLEFEHAVFRHAEISEQRLVLYTPTCEHDTPAKLERLLELEADLEPLALSG